ncbi:HD domain-containing protein [Deinococcus aquiradiocola]|uniref:Phosphohydrolase n=1 Tax=Deinococcus aquiradiocola TaxID=393059 RepID=A0A917PD22_9DEIO|nr:HD domain-containing protein [Deinococcus aquiradiocola]GGJ71499.1 phosphohydrolase [Deinococcus aquiradiocola]
MPAHATPRHPLARLQHVGAKVTRLARSVSVSQARPDDTWAARHLTPGETRVYLGMDPRDREHAVRVAQAILNAEGRASPDLLAAALLHDCGKQVRPYRVWERVGAGLIPGPLCRLLPLGPLWVRGEHPDLGARLLRAAGARPRVVDLVRRHHTPGPDPDAVLLHRYDNIE